MVVQISVVLRLWKSFLGSCLLEEENNFVDQYIGNEMSMRSIRASTSEEVNDNLGVRELAVYSSETELLEKFRFLLVHLLNLGSRQEYGKH